MKKIIEDDQVTISKGEYEKLKQIEKESNVDTSESPLPPHIYSRVNISVATLDKIIIAGILVIAVAIVVGILL